MKKYIWIILAIVLAALLLAGIVLISRSGNDSDKASSPNGETEIIPGDPNEPWPDLSAGASSDASSVSSTASPDASSGNAGTGSAVSSGNGSTVSDLQTLPDSSDPSVNATSGDTAPSGGSVSSGTASSPDSSGNADSNPDSGVSPTPDTGSEDGSPAAPAEGLHEYELPYISLS